MGGVQFLLFIVAFFFFPNPKASACAAKKDNKEADTLPMMPLLKTPLFSMTLLMLFCGCVSINFVEPNIQLHLLPVSLRGLLITV